MSGASHRTRVLHVYPNGHFIQCHNTPTTIIFPLHKACGVLLYQLASIWIHHLLPQITCLTYQSVGNSRQILMNTYIPRKGFRLLHAHLCSFPLILMMCYMHRFVVWDQYYGFQRTDQLLFTSFSGFPVSSYSADSDNADLLVICQDIM